MAARRYKKVLMVDVVGGMDMLLEYRCGWLSMEDVALSC